VLRGPDSFRGYYKAMFSSIGWSFDQAIYEQSLYAEKIYDENVIGWCWFTISFGTRIGPGYGFNLGVCDELFTLFPANASKEPEQRL